MKNREIVLKIIGILLLILFVYMAWYRAFNPEYFLYYDQVNVMQQYDPTHPPFYSCNFECKWLNVPIGADNIYLRTHNPFMYWLFSNQMLLIGISILIALLIQRKTIQKYIKRQKVGKNI